MKLHGNGLAIQQCTLVAFLSSTGPDGRIIIDEEGNARNRWSFPRGHYCDLFYRFLIVRNRRSAGGQKGAIPPEQGEALNSLISLAMLTARSGLR